MALFLGGLNGAAQDKVELRAAACAKMASATEQAICNDRQLTRYDGQVQELYTQIKAKASDDELLPIRLDQRGWVQDRNACKADDACITAQFKKRIPELELALSALGSARAQTWSNASARMTSLPPAAA